MIVVGLFTACCGLWCTAASETAGVAVMSDVQYNARGTLYITLMHFGCESVDRRAKNAMFNIISSVRKADVICKIFCTFFCLRMLLFRVYHPHN